jgi:hypothetical protein
MPYVCVYNPKSSFFHVCKIRGDQTVLNVFFFLGFCFCFVLVLVFFPHVTESFPSAAAAFAGFSFFFPFFPFFFPNLSTGKWKGAQGLEECVIFSWSCIAFCFIFALLFLDLTSASFFLTPFVFLNSYIDLVSHHAHVYLLSCAYFFVFGVCFLWTCVWGWVWGWGAADGVWERCFCDFVLEFFSSGFFFWMIDDSTRYTTTTHTTYHIPSVSSFFFFFVFCRFLLFYRFVCVASFCCLGEDSNTGTEWYNFLYFRLFGAKRNRKHEIINCRERRDLSTNPPAMSQPPPSRPPTPPSSPDPRAHTPTTAHSHPPKASDHIVTERPPFPPPPPPPPSFPPPLARPPPPTPIPKPR